MYLANGTIMVLLFLLKSASERPQHKFVKFRIKLSVPYSTTDWKLEIKRMKTWHVRLAYANSDNFLQFLSKVAAFFYDKL